jgi:transposase
MEHFQRNAEPDFAAFVAIDWADTEHVWSMQARLDQRRETGRIHHSPESVDVWITSLLMRFNNQPIAVALEQSRGALVFMLSKYAQLHLYPIHPRAAAQFRSALFPSGAKDDPTDADLLLEMLLQHRRHLRRLDPDTEQTRTLQMLVEDRRMFVNENTRQSNRLTCRLKLYFPQILTWFDEVDSPLVGAFLQRWPTLETAQRARPETLRKFFHNHNCRSDERIELRLQQIRNAVPATCDPAVIRSGIAAVVVLVQLIETLRNGVTSLDKEIEAISRTHPDFAIFESLPGAGKVMVPRLIAAIGSRRDRFVSASELQSYSGIAPVMQRSGKSQWVHFRWACPTFVRQTFHEWAGHSIASSEWARACYKQQRERGKGHHAAVRALAFKWIRIIFRCWQDGQPYQPDRYEDARRQRTKTSGASVPADNPQSQWKSVAGFSRLTSFNT